MGIGVRSEDSCPINKSENIMSQTIDACPISPLTMHLIEYHVPNVRVRVRVDASAGLGLGLVSKLGRSEG